MSFFMTFFIPILFYFNFFKEHNAKHWAKWIFRLPYIRFCGEACMHASCKHVYTLKAKCMLFVLFEETNGCSFFSVFVSKS